MTLLLKPVRVLATIVLAAVLGSALFAAPAPSAERVVPGEIVIKLTTDCRALVSQYVTGSLDRLGVPEVDRLNARWGVKKIWKISRARNPKPALVKNGVDLMYWLVADPSTDPAAMAADYARCSRVLYAVPNIERPLDEVPNDPRYTGQWHLPKIQAPGAWDFCHGDTHVRIGVVDNGCDFTHPDIANNVWINSAEDLNQNGKFDTLWYPDGDLDGVDDDGNGYVDDVIGYNMLDHTPSPKPPSYDDHGTHCWGISDAVTNNDTGIASVAWGCRGLGFRCGTNGTITIAAAIEAIAYSVNQGVWVTSHSYGSTSPYQPEEDVMQSAVDAGGIVCCAAGNDGVQSPHYPGAYEMVVGVAASDQADHRSIWGGGQGSNYGDWVEVASPGSSILSTVPGGGYASWDGTSMATPLVAGLCALIKAADPGIDNQTCLDRLYNGCDTMPDADYRAGLMGHGRINAMKALAISRRSYLTLTGTHLNDPNHNGIAEPGEVCGLTATLANAINWQDATSIAGTLALTDPDIALTKPGATFPNISNGGSGDCSADSFVFTVQPSAVPHMVRFQISKTAVPGDVGPDGYVTIQVGQPRILLVDDYAGDAVSRWYREGCDSLRVLYDQYQVQTSGAPSSDTLRHYSVVIWYTGRDSTQCVSSACQTALAAYLDNGGKLFISGQNIGQLIGSSGFYANYLKAEYDTASTGKIFNLGVPGDPICDGDTIVCGGAGGASDALSVDGIKPVGGAVGSSIFKDYPDPSVYGSVHFAGSFKTVYFSMPFEAIDHATQRYVQKWTILRRIMNFFGEPLPYAIAEDVGVTSLRSANLRVIPNPVSRCARIEYALMKTLPVRVRIYDVHGRLVRTVAAGAQASGWHHLAWDLNDVRGQAVANGIYFCSVSAGAENLSTKLLVTR